MTHLDGLADEYEATIKAYKIQRAELWASMHTMLRLAREDYRGDYSDEDARRALIRWQNAVNNYRAAAKSCTHEIHDLVRLDDVEWNRMEHAEDQPSTHEDDPTLEQRQCPCGSTLAREKQ